MNDRFMADANNTNFINSLVDNWIPNMPFGEYTPFGESPLPPQNMSSTHNNSSTIPITIASNKDCINMPAHAVPDMKNGNLSVGDSNLNINTIGNHSSNNLNVIAAAAVTSTSNPILSDCKEAFIQSNLLSMGSAQTATTTAAANAASASSCTNGNFQQCDSTNVNKPASDVKKPRMIAEVKPMRMSYSDVLSKNVFIKDDMSEAHTLNNRNAGGVNSIANGTNAAGTNPLQKPTKAEKVKNLINASGEKKSTDEYASAFKGKAASNPSMAQNMANMKNSSSFDSDSKPSESGDNKQSKKKLQANAANSAKVAKNAKSASTEFLQKRRSQTDLNAPSSSKDFGDAKGSSNNGYFYNITKNENELSHDKPYVSYTKTNQSRKSASNKTFSSSATGGSSGRSGNAPRNEKSTTYQQKRSSKSRKNNTYELLLRLAYAWLNYMLLFFKWLIALVTDVFMLSVGIIWDQFSSAYEYSCHMLYTARNELTNNSGRPYAYFTNLWHRFDNKFNKDSKWAVWRRLFSKKKPPESIPDYYKNGRLPQTGDEAMYSLLNCKGKDAYRYAQAIFNSISKLFGLIVFKRFNFQHTWRTIRLLTGTDTETLQENCCFSSSG